MSGKKVFNSYIPSNQCSLTLSLLVMAIAILRPGSKGLNVYSKDATSFIIVTMFGPVLCVHVGVTGVCGFEDKD